MGKVAETTYEASPTGWKFHQDREYFPKPRRARKRLESSRPRVKNKEAVRRRERPKQGIRHRVRGLMGPVGSGKSVACCWELFGLMREQEPDAEGMRKTRWAVIRNTYRELEDTTMQTWFDWFPKSLGHWVAKSMTHIVEFPWTDVNGVPDGTRVRAEVLFRALDRPNDIKKLLSLELTGAWVNEARELPYPIIRMLRARCGRYPRKIGGKHGPTFYGVIMDTNPPDDDHWWYKMFEEKRPNSWKLWRQPSGLSDEAENIKNLPETYYEDMMEGNDQAWIDVYVHGKYGFVIEGKPIYPEYKDDVHCSAEFLEYDETLELHIGIDFGLTPAALFAQKSPTGQWRIIDELVTEDMDAKSFGKELHTKILKEYRDARLQITGDPAGEQRAQTDKQTPFDMLHSEGINAVPAHSNDVTLRRDAMADPMKRLDFVGEPAFMVSPKARRFRKAMMGGYKYRRLQVSDEERFHDKPDKNMYSHVAEAGQYLFLGAGEDTQMLGGVTTVHFKVKKAGHPKAGKLRRRRAA